MSVVSVEARSFILALFIRDDGERFLLGDNGYDFIDSQLHFVANTIENDEVEKQGADGVMLAGQVRRASVQTFDGYVGDATTPKEEIEQMRRAFIAFFAKDHHFRVIYVDCNRNAWQRKGGYLVDAPEVKELWQVHPEYHVGLNFEDVNYYEYDENAEGQEILANIMKVPISSDVEGGLVWDEDGAVSEDATVVYDGDTATASGKSISVSDAVEAPLSDFKLKGETSQNGTPTPDAPVAVQTVTGENVVKISDGQNEQSYEVNLGKNLFDKDNANIFNGYLGKIGDYQDYIWKDGDTWKIHKAVGKSVLNGSESNWATQTSGGLKRYSVNRADSKSFPSRTSDASLSSHFTPSTTDAVGIFFVAAQTYYFYPDQSIATLDSWKSWLASNNVALYYQLAAPTDTEITVVILFVPA